MASFEEQATNAAAALSEMGYEYRDGKLTDTTTGEGFAWKGQQHYDQLSDCVLTYVQDALLVSPECGLQKMEVPPPEGADEDCPRSFVYCSADFETNTDKLLVLIQGTGRVRAGVWGCALCINDTLQNGTMDGYLRSAREQGYAVVILNPNMNHTADDTVIPGSQSKEGHTVHAWDTLVSKSPASNLYVVGHSYGGVCTCALLAHRWDEIRPRVRVRITPSPALQLRSIAFTDSVHSPQQLKDDQAMHTCFEMDHCSAPAALVLCFLIYLCVCLPTEVLSVEPAGK
eukprot:TRINITY_DN5820_c0_g1_i1.p1 TRINITY_DN5820_c0_g1~~TRINITY_DN5820_c0_g1_i1.p1  ORF type:complete len:286 (-),score=52.76 TRINITY_DN5820_c0_g1_i1:325-1182(-)